MHPGVAQLVEHGVWDAEAAGSSPVPRTTIKIKHQGSTMACYVCRDSSGHLRSNFTTCRCTDKMVKVARASTERSSHRFPSSTSSTRRSSSDDDDSRSSILGSGFGSSFGSDSGGGFSGGGGDFGGGGSSSGFGGSDD